MIKTSKAAVAVLAALAATTGCSHGATPAGDARPAATPAADTPSASAAPSGQPGTGSTGVRPASPPPSAASTPPSATAGARPVTAGHSLCVDLSSPAVRDAVAQLPPFNGVGYTAGRGTDAKQGDCPDLLWVQASLKGGTGSSPEWILFFDRQGYLGTATSRYTTFTSVVGSTRDSVAVSYRWLNPGDSTAGVSGGPVVVTYHLSGRKVTPDKDVPPQVFGGAATPTAQPAKPHG